tara:strand:- start:297 stop:485 length:189 start_codon:yes stop_codon:yes gene_type:complete
MFTAPHTASIESSIQLAVAIKHLLQPFQFDRQQRFTTKPLTSWEQWLASDGPTTVSPLRETT